MLFAHRAIAAGLSLHEWHELLCITLGIFSFKATLEFFKSKSLTYNKSAVHYRISLADFINTIEWM